MAVREILRMGDERLLALAKPVTDFNDPELQTLVTDMFDTMAAHGGVGLAAPQIGVDLQIVVFGCAHNERYPKAEPVPETVLVNPILTPVSDDEDVAWEGCLSLPGMRGEVTRFSRVRYRGFDARGQQIDREVDGFHARVVQHECDHLIGKLFPMRVRDFRRFGFTEVMFPELPAQ